MASVPQNPSLRKPPARQLAERMAISPLTARLVEERVSELLAAGERTEFSRILARELGAPEAYIDRVVAALMLRYRTEAATLRAGVTGALDASREAARDVWEEVA
ncbi:MAG: hypothetical protein KatS3mg004_1872 [Bryobacteraceae bacterium]|nr:MAG: hypothetical protein KatS3mg004_1872 [Bryobacteraceae bacterium]